VAIIDENDIWAVGEVYTDSGKYNAAHWDGKKWELKKIANDTYPRRIVYAFDKNDVWFDGSIKWNGTGYSVHMKNFPLMPNGDGWYRNAMWGIASDDFYVVGDHGMIAHYDGHSWTKIASGTDFPINDIYGLIDNHDYIFLTAGDTFKPEQGLLLRINKYKVNKLIWDETKPVQSIYIANSHKYYIAGYYLYTNIVNQWIEVKNSIPSFCNSIRGNGENDIYAACDNFKIIHFNGNTWKTFNFKIIGILSSIQVKKNNIAACGYDSRTAYIILGKQ